MQMRGRKEGIECRSKAQKDMALKCEEGKQST